VSAKAVEAVVRKIDRLVSWSRANRPSINCISIMREDMRVLRADPEVSQQFGIFITDSRVTYAEFELY
jgi:hypothetical protein